MVLEDGVVAGFDDSGIFRGIGKLAVVGTKVRADGEAALFFHLFIAQFLPPRLDGEVGLALRHDFFSRVRVLDDEVAGVAGHYHDLERALRSAANFDHFGDLNEMVVHALAAVETGGAGGFDDRLEIPVIGVAEHFGEVAAGPEFVTGGVRPADGFKGSDFVAHGCLFGMFGASDVLVTTAQ